MSVLIFNLPINKKAPCLRSGVFSYAYEVSCRARAAEVSPTTYVTLTRPPLWFPRCARPRAFGVLSYPYVFMSPTL